MADGTSPTQPLTTNTGSLVFSSEFPTAGLFDVMSLSATGFLKFIGSPAVPPPARSTALQGPAPLGLWAHPKLPYLYAGLTAASQIGVFRWTPTGKVSFVRRVPTGGAAPCWVRVNRAGTRIYVSDTASAAISVFDSSNPAAPVEKFRHWLWTPPGSSSRSRSTRQSGFYVVGQRAAPDQPGTANSLHVARVLADGKLSEVAASPVPLPVATDSRPQGVAAL